MCIRQRIEGSNPSLTAIFEIRARTKVRAFFFCILPRGRDENPRLRVRQLPTASWTDCERSERAARRASAASQSLPVLDATPCGLKRRVALTLTRPTKPKPSLDPVGLISAAPSGIFAKCGTVLPGPLTLTLSPGEREQSNKTQTHSLLNHPRILPGQKIHQRSDGR